MSDEQADAAADEEPDVEETTEAEETESEDTEAEETESGLQAGDFVRLDYTATTAEDGDVIDTTDPEVAEEEGFDEEEGRDFEPRVIVLGEGHIFEGVDQAIQNSTVGDSGTVEVPAAEAFGERDPEEVRTVSADKIPEDDRYPGAQVQVDGDQGHVETIIGGRARVDFNHPLAGQDIEYEYEVVEEVDDRVEQAQGLISMYLEADLDMWIQTDEVEEETVVQPDEDDEDAEPTTETETVEKETLYIESTPQLAMNQQWMFQKQQIAQNVMDHLGLDRVVVQETIEGGGMPGMGGMMGGGAGGAGGEDLAEMVEDADVDEEEIVEELEGELGEELDDADGDGEAAEADADEE